MRRLRRQRLLGGARRVLSAEEVSAARDLVWDMLEGFGSGIRRDEPESWGPPHWPNTGSSGILGTLGTQRCALAGQWPESLWPC